MNCNATKPGLFTYLHLSSDQPGNNIGDGGASSIGEALKTNSSLSALTLWSENTLFEAFSFFDTGFEMVLDTH